MRQSGDKPIASFSNILVHSFSNGSHSRWRLYGDISGWEMDDDDDDDDDLRQKCEEKVNLGPGVKDIIEVV